MDAPLAVQAGSLKQERAEQEQRHGDDDDPGDPGENGVLMEDGPAEGADGESEEDEYGAESADEQEGISRGDDLE